MSMKGMLLRSLSKRLRGERFCVLANYSSGRENFETFTQAREAAERLARKENYAVQIIDQTESAKLYGGRMGHMSWLVEPDGTLRDSQKERKETLEDDFMREKIEKLLGPQ